MLRIGLLVMACVGVVAGTSSCRIGDNVPDNGESCDDSSECEGALSCVPTNPNNPQGARVCMPPPEGFDSDRCKAFFIGDPDAICDCGCGAHDVDCADENATSCDAADGNHCPTGKNPKADDNAQCV